MNIDMTQMVTAADKAAQTEAARLEAIKAECKRRIFAVAGQTAQTNLSASAAAGLLTTTQMATYKAGLAWVAAMRAACATMPAGMDFLADASWPAIPAGVVDLAGAF